MGIEDSVEARLREPLAALGLVLEDVTVTPAGKRRLVRVAVDRRLADGPEDVTTGTAPLSLDEVADATSRVSDELDASDVLGSLPYVLEVSSPGVDRPLTQPRHFRRNVTRLLRITPVDGEPVVGRLVRAGDERVTLVVPSGAKAPARTLQLPYAAIARAVVEVEFTQAVTHPQPQTLHRQQATDEES